MRTVAALTVLAMLLTWLAGCSQPTVDPEASPEFPGAELFPVRNTGFAQAFVRKDANLSSYTALLIEPLDVSNVDIPTTLMQGTLRRDWELTPERASALQSAWNSAMQSAFSAYTLNSESSDALRVSARLSRIAPGRQTTSTIGVELQPLNPSRDAIEVWAEFRLTDSKSGELLAVVRDNRTLSGASPTRTAPITFNLLFRSWAALLHTRISGR